MIAAAFLLATAAAHGAVLDDDADFAPTDIAAMRAEQRLPGWDDASTSAGCLAMTSNMAVYLPDAAATREQIEAEGQFWTWRLRAAAPDEPEQISYWEAAHGWLEHELKSRELGEAQEFLSIYRGQCVVAQAQAQSEAMWEAAR